MLKYLVVNSIKYSAKNQKDKYLTQPWSEAINKS